MKREIYCALAVSAVLFPPMAHAAAAESEAGFQQIFNGKDLTGWNGNPQFWSVKDGAIVGQTTAENPTKGNTFIIWTGGSVGDFELRLSYRIAPGNDRANTGIQYRSKVLDEKTWAVGGYQADMEAGQNYSGILYDEGGAAGGRQIMAARGEKVVWDKDCKKQVTGSLGKSEDLQAAIKNGDWNDYVIIVKGNHLQHFINGKQTVDVTDECEAKALKSGVLALQLHAGPPMTVHFKNIRLKTLAGGVGLRPRTSGNCRAFGKSPAARSTVRRSRSQTSSPLPSPSRTSPTRSNGTAERTAVRSRLIPRSSPNKWTFSLARETMRATSCWRFMKLARTVFGSATPRLVMTDQRHLRRNLIPGGW
jgi:hypothetical protein